MASSEPFRSGWVALGLIVVGLAIATVTWLAGDPAEQATATLPVVAEAIAPSQGPEAPEGDVSPLLEDFAEPPEPTPAFDLADRLARITRLEQTEEPTEGLRLVVVDGASQPVPDARVEVWAGPEALMNPGTEPEAVHSTDGKGRCAFELGTGGGVLFASKPGVGTSGLWSWNGLGVGDDGAAVITLAPTATLRGQVVHADLGPAIGVDVLFLPRGRGGRGSGRIPTGRVTTDGDGRFEVAIDARARLTVSALDGDLVSHETPVMASPGEELEVVVRFPGRWSIDGVLVDPVGEPVVGASVTLWRHFPGHDILGGDRPQAEPHRAETETGEQGLFRFEVPLPGEYILIGQGEETPPSRSEVAFVDDAVPRASVRLLLPVTSAITGRLVAANGLPLPEVTIRARPAHLYDRSAFAYGPTVWGLYGEAEDETDEEGHFELGPLHPEGNYIVFCRPDEDLPDQKLVVKDVRPDGRELLLVATEDELRRGWVAGTVLSDATGLPVTEFVPTLVIELDGRVIDTEQSPVSSEDGSFRIEGLAPGYRYALRIAAPGHGTVELPWFTASHRGEQVTVRLPPVGSLQVVVAGPRGRGIELAEVTIRRQAQVATWRDARNGHTDERGRARFEELPPGRYRIQVRHGDRRGEGTAEVPNAGSVTTSVELPR